MAPNLWSASPGILAVELKIKCGGGPEMQVDFNSLLQMNLERESTEGPEPLD